MKKIMIIALAACLAIVLSCFCGYMLNDRMNALPADASGESAEDENIYKPDTVSPEREISEILVKGVQKECRLITMEVSLNCDIIIDDSYYGWDVFKKRQKLIFYAAALFSVNLEKFSADDISFAESEEEKTVYIYIEKPQLVCLAVDNDKTVIGKTENGLFRFGDIKITSESYNEIEREAVRKMTEQINNEEIKSLNEYNAKLSVKEFFLNILKVTAYSDYEIVAEYK